MKWYMNLKIGTKQLLGHLVLLILTGFLGLFALHGLGTVREQAAELAERRFPLTQALSELRPSMFHYRVSEIDYVFTLDPDERDLRKSKMQSGLTDSETALEKLAPLLNTPEEKKLFQAVKADLDKCKTETNAVLELVAQKKDMEAQSEETGTANGNFDDLMSDIKAAIDLESECGRGIEQDQQQSLSTHPISGARNTDDCAGLGTVHGHHQFPDDRPVHS